MIIDDRKGSSFKYEGRLFEMFCSYNFQTFQKKLIVFVSFLGLFVSQFFRSKMIVFKQLSVNYFMILKAFLIINDTTIKINFAFGN